MEKYTLMGLDPETGETESIDSTYSRVEAERWLSEAWAEAGGDNWPAYYLHVDVEPDEEEEPYCEPGEECPPNCDPRAWALFLIGMRESDFI